MQPDTPVYVACRHDSSSFAGHLVVPRIIMIDSDTIAVLLGAVVAKCSMVTRKHMVVSNQDQETSPWPRILSQDLDSFSGRSLLHVLRCALVYIVGTLTPRDDPLRGNPDGATGSAVCGFVCIAFLLCSEPRYRKDHASWIGPNGRESWVLQCT